MTENEKIERLMQPRYKVIADYPGRPSSMPIGHILTLDKFGAGKWWHEYTDLEPIHIDEGSKRFPVVLKQLEWWEERTAEEMPEYVKFIEQGVIDFVLKVEKYILHRDINVFWAFEYLWQDEPDTKRMAISGWEPATKEQYLSQVKTIQNK